MDTPDAARVGSTVAHWARAVSTGVRHTRRGDPLGEVLREEDRLLVERLYPGLRRFAAAVHPSGVDPDDLVQEALVRVLAHGPLRDLGFPAAYLRRTILNLAANQHRRSARALRALARLGRGVPVRDDYPSDLADLMRLPPRARAVLYLSAVEGLTYAEIAAVLGGSEGSARMAASRARRRLAARVAREGLT